MTELLDLLASPALLFSAVLAVFYAALFHVWQGRTVSGFFWLCLASFVGFGIGQYLGGFMGLPTIGEVQILTATVGAVAVMWVTKTRKV